MLYDYCGSNCSDYDIKLMEENKMGKRGKVLINVNDIIGKRLGKLEVISYEGNYYDMTLGGERMRHAYKVKCECGTIKMVQRGQLVSEIVHSCGCGRRGRRGN